MAKQTFTTGQVLTAAQMTSLQQTAMLGGNAAVKTTSYVLVAADAGTSVAMNSTSATTVTVNTGLFAAGDTVTIINQNTGVCTVTAGTATVRKSSGASLALSQYQGGVLNFISASEAIFFPFDAGGGLTSPLTTKGDLWTYSTTDARLGVGTNGQYLSADSTEGTGLKWVTPSTASFVGVSVSNSSNISVANATYVQLTWNTEQYDTSSFHSTVTNTSRITMPSTGKYLITGISSFESNGTGARFVFYYLNGSLTARLFCVGQQGAAVEPGISFAHVITFTAGDYIEFYAYQTSGISLNYQSGYPIQVTYLGA